MRDFSTLYRTIKRRYLKPFLYRIKSYQMTLMSMKHLKLGLFLLLLLLVLILLILFSFSHELERVAQIFKMAATDQSRTDMTVQMQAEDEWLLHRNHMDHYKSGCGSAAPRGKVAWVTALNNDKYVIPTVVLGHLLNRMSCVEDKVVLVGEGVSRLGRDALRKIGFTIVDSEGLDCNYMDREWGRSEQNKGITGTHTRLLVFNMTQYDKLIYLDSDYFPTSPLDHLFDQVKPGKLIASYCSKPGIVDPCFNAGLVGLVPDVHTFTSLMAMWKDMSRSSCPDDQRLLWYYYVNSHNWTPIPYAYNVRRERYYPMRSYHFAGHGREPRPWEWSGRPSEDELSQFNRPMYTVMDIISLWWRYLLEAVEQYGLGEFWAHARQFLK